jgi:hypothetical protein
MLSTNALNTASSAAAHLGGLGISILPNGSNELAELNRTSYPIEDVKLYTEGEYTNFLKFVSTSSKNDFHERVMADATEELGKLVSSHISHSKNVVAVAVQEMANKYTEFLESLKVSDPLRDYNIEQRAIPNLLSNVYFEGSIALEPNYETLVLSDYFSLPPLDEDGLLKFLNFQDKALDNEILQWVLESNNRVLNMYNSIFSSSTSYGYTLKDIEFLNNYDKLDMGILLVLVANKLKAEVQGDQTKMSLNKYNSLCHDYINVGSWTIEKSRVAINRSINAGFLITYSDYSTKTVSVNAGLYNQWLSSSGRPEILLGHFIENGDGLTIEEIEKKADPYISVWNNYCALVNTQFEHGLSNTIRNWLVDYGYTLAEELKENTPSSPGNGPNVVSSKRIVEQVVKELSKEELKKPYHVALSVVAKGVYFFTSSYPFLRTMHEIGESNPDIDARSAATIAAIDYVTEYVYSLIGFKK